MFAAYKVGVHLSLVNGVSAGLLGIITHMGVFDRSVHGANTRLGDLHTQMQKIKNLGMIGAGVATLGVGALILLKGPYEDAKKLAQAKTDFETLNLSSVDNASAYAKAASMSQKILGTNITDNLKGIHDLHTAFGDLHHAIATADSFAKFGFVARVMNKGAPVEGLVYNAAKALEHRGQKVMGDDGAFKEELDMMERVYLGSRGKVNPSEFFHASQTGKLAYTLMSKEELYGPFAAYMQAKSGATAGTAQMTFNSSLIGGHMTDSAKGFLADLGLWDEKISKTRVALMAQQAKGLSPEERKSMGLLMPTHGGLKDEFVEMATQHTSQFVQQVMVPRIKKRFGLDLSDEQIATMLMTKFNRNTSDVMGEYIVNALKFQKDADIFNRTKSGEGAYQAYLKSPEGAEIAATEAWKNLSTVVGSIYIQPITNGLLSLADSLTKLGVWTTAHPNITKDLVYGFIGLSAAMAFGGTVLLLSAAVSGLSLGFPVLGTVIGALATPIGIAVLAIGTLAGALYAFRPETEKEVDAAKTDGGARLTTGARERAAALGWDSKSTMTKKALDWKNTKKWYWYQFGRQELGEPPSAVAAGQKRPVTIGTGAADRPAQTGAPYAAGGKQSMQIVVNNIMDGRVISQSITERMINDMMRPAAGLNSYDGSMGIMSPSQAR
jgi:hypothetical protein